MNTPNSRYGASRTAAGQAPSVTHFRPARRLFLTVVADLPAMLAFAGLLAVLTSWYIIANPPPLQHAKLAHRMQEAAR